MPSVRRFKIRTALRDKIRDAEIRAKNRGEAWEAQVYLLPQQAADPLFSHEEKMGTAVLFRVDSEEAALNEMMRHLKQYFRLEIED